MLEIYIQEFLNKLKLKSEKTKILVYKGVSLTSNICNE